MDERELTKRALRDDREAWEALIARHQRRVVVGLLARGLPLDRAEELAQEAWTRVIEQQRRGALVELKLPGLVIAQAKFLAVDELRKRGLISPSGSDSDLPDAPDLAASAEERLVDRARLARAQAALSECSASAQEIFRLRYEEPGLAHEELAARVGLSVQRVRQIICEVRKRLRAAVEEEHA